MTTETSRADRVLVWLMLAGLVLGGLATMVVAFSAEGVLARLSATQAEGHDAAGSDAHDETDDGHGEVPAEHSMPMGTGASSGDHDMSMPMTTVTSTSDHDAEMPLSTAPSSGDHGMTMPMGTPTP